MRLQLAAWKDLLKRYAKIWKALWQQRERLDSPERNDIEREFLPAALELEETPVSPAPRIAMWIISGFAVFAVAWACLGQLDVVVTAEGKIVPNERTKVIQPAETAVVKAIYVQDGQLVRENDLLLELDGTVAEADERRVRGDWMSARLACARAKVFLKAIRTNQDQPIRLKIPDTQALLTGITNDRIGTEETTLAAQVEEYRAKLNKIEADIYRNEAQITSGRMHLKEMEETLPIIRGRAEDYKKLYEQDYVSKHDYLDKEKERIALDHEIAAQNSKLAELEFSLLASRRERESWVAGTRRSLQEALLANEQRALETSQEQIKAAQHVRLMQLRAPVSGQVQQLAIHTVGGVVTPAQSLMVIVPGKESIEIEASIQNKDIGFVHEGQEAVVKIAAFPYTKYGTVEGKLKSVSMDAVADEKRGLIYASRVAVFTNAIRVEDKKIPLSPGMAVTVEIKTGKRRVMEYFLSPLMEQANESLRER